MWGGKVVLKLVGKAADGGHPERESGRFLTEIAGYRNVPALLGSVEYGADDGARMALAVLQQFVRNQGDGWRMTLDYLKRELDEVRLGVSEPDVQIGRASCRERVCQYV